MTFHIFIAIDSTQQLAVVQLKALIELRGPLVIVHDHSNGEGNNFAVRKEIRK